MNDLLIIVINWRREDETISCLKDLFPLRSKNDSVFLIDNQSTTNSKEALLKHNEFFDYFESKEKNTGFSGACNIGIKFAHHNGFNKVLFLNTDAELETDTIDKMKTELDLYNAALVSPVLHDTISRVPYFCGMKPRLEELKLEPLTIDNLSQINTTEKQGLIIHGTVLMGSVQKLTNVGGFDDDFFAYWEDTELCQRLLVEGYDCRTVSNAIAYHPSSRNKDGNTVRSGYFYYYMARNEILFWKKCTKGLKKYKAIYWHITRSVDLMKELKSYGHIKESKSIVTGILHGIFSQFGKWKKQ
ncbi:MULTISPECIES: glycosyltransferase family 2 protein [Colwellia]|uniref:dTDP-rhamnosyl transferase RfbF n=1 Tax=Colwellia marinimaniae TaxID=1513592 RepID=A0ABQ0MT57_9GAMM|nr:MULTISPECIES: glycosyltransferase family 2 protein [Colwellia]GAW95544.1 dTDP-rhamnosyl transferase RfbF [Colwellia marinimaniae]